MKLREWLLELFFPTKCIICRRLLGGGKPYICPDCMDKLPFTNDGGRQKGDFFSDCVSPVFYEKKMREAILRYKFGGARAYAAAFGTLLASCIYEELEGKYDIITWVPLDPGRLRKRGYDQTRLLAEEACCRLNRELTCCLRKKRGVKAQSATGAPEARRANIAGAYEVIDPALVADKRILVIDDIVTSGSTLSECAKTLLLAGAEDVVCAALARTE